ncbi:MAG: ABC transporter ATP-binding protein [Cellvibrio sp.]
MALIDITQLAFKSQLKPLDFSADAGEIIGILGPNGAGKTTFLKSIAGLLDAEGEIRVEGELLSHSAKRAQVISYLPQQQDVHWSLSVRDIVALGRAPFGFSEPERIDEAMKMCGVETFSTRSIDQLSGGEQARVHLARVIATQAKVLLADEPLASLDLWYQQQVMRVLRHYADQQHCVVMTIHDLSLAARYCDKLVMIHEGQLIASGSAQDVLTQENIRLAYGVDVLIDLNHQPPLIMAR